MKSCLLFLAICSSALLLFSGCGRILPQFSCASNQIDNAHIQIVRAQRAIRSIFLYDQYDTELLCAALWLSDGVKHCYKQLRAFHHATTPDAISDCYTQAPVAFLIMIDGTLGYGSADWFPILRISKRTYTPISITPINLPQEFQIILGRRYHSRHAYLVIFDAPRSGIPILSLRSSIRSVTMTWHTRRGVGGQQSGKERTRIL